MFSCWTPHVISSRGRRNRQGGAEWRKLLPGGKMVWGRFSPKPSQNPAKNSYNTHLLIRSIQHYTLSLQASQGGLGFSLMGCVQACFFIRMNTFYLLLSVPFSGLCARVRRDIITSSHRAVTFLCFLSKWLLHLWGRQQIFKTFCLYRAFTWNDIS